MTSAERGYSTCGRESLAVTFPLREFRVYLLSDIPFEMVTGHKSLQYAFKKQDVYGRLARWMDFLAEYNFTVKYRAGVENGAADFLWSNPTDDRKFSSDEGNIVGAISEVNSWPPDLEVEFIDTMSYLEGCGINNDDKRFCLKIRRGKISTSSGMASVSVVKVVHYDLFRA